MLPEFLSNEWILIYGGLFLTLFIVFVETASPVGSIIPGGELLLFITGLLGGTQWVEVNILFLLVPITLISFMADLTGYTIGYNLGQKIYEKPKSSFYRKKYLKRTEKFNKKYGVFALMFARFFPIIRTFNPIWNGARESSFQKFFIFSGLGALVYVNGLILFGFFIGRKFPSLKEDVEYIIAAVLVFIFITPIITLIRRNRKTESNIQN
jgi:membrane-associated protein